MKPTISGTTIEGNHWWTGKNALERKWKLSVLRSSRHLASWGYEWFTKQLWSTVGLKKEDPDDFCDAGSLTCPCPFKEKKSVYAAASGWLGPTKWMEADVGVLQLILNICVVTVSFLMELNFNILFLHTRNRLGGAPLLLCTRLALKLVASWRNCEVGFEKFEFSKVYGNLQEILLAPKHRWPNLSIQ